MNKQAVKKQTLSEMRKTSGLKTTQIAYIVGVSYPSIRNWETGKSIPNAIYLKRLLDLYHKTHDDLDWSVFETAMETMEALDTPNL